MSFVNATTKKTGASAVGTLTSPSFSSVGANWLGVIVATSTSVTASTPTDSAGNTYVAAPSSPYIVVAGMVKHWIFICENALTSASHTITCNIAAAATDNYSFSGIALGGRATSSSLETIGSPTAINGPSTTHTGPSTGTLPQAGDDVVMMFGDNGFFTTGNNANYTAGASLTIPALGVTSDSRTEWTSAVAYQTNVGTTSVATGFSSDSSDTAGMMVLAVKALGAGAPAIGGRTGIMRPVGRGPQMNKRHSAFRRSEGANVTRQCVFQLFSAPGIPLANTSVSLTTTFTDLTAGVDVRVQTTDSNGMIYMQGLMIPAGTYEVRATIPGDVHRSRNLTVIYY